MRKGVIGLSMQTLVVIVFAIMILVIGLMFAFDFFTKNLNFLNNTVPR